MNAEDRLRISRDQNLLVLVGQVDAHTAPQLEEFLDPLPDGSDPVTLEMSAVEFIDSSGLRVLIEANQRAERAGRTLVLRHPSRAVSRLLEISGLDGHLSTDVT
jgi:anti-sigma B factor antagonist